MKKLLLLLMLIVTINYIPLSYAYKDGTQLQALKSNMQERTGQHNRLEELDYQSLTEINNPEALCIESLSLLAIMIIISPIITDLLLH